MGAVAAAALGAVLTAGDAVPARQAPAAAAPGCTRIAITNAVIDFLALVADRRPTRVQALWLPRRRLPTPAFFYLRTGGRTIRVQLGKDVPEATRMWLERGPPELRVLLLDPRPVASQPAASQYTLSWLRRGDAGPALLGTGKGVWDCERRRLAMFVGGERPYADESAAVEAMGRPCGRRGFTFHTRAGHRIQLCRPWRT